MTNLVAGSPIAVALWEAGLMTNNSSSQDSGRDTNPRETFRFDESVAAAQNPSASEPTPEEVEAIGQQMRDIADVAAVEVITTS
ncbi:MAG: hypothetical protein L0G46_10060, partial [Kocuria sp.]|nr:hypothetical protein [Kocuria sp.]